MKNSSLRNRVHKDGPKGTLNRVEEEISRYGVKLFL